MKIVGNSTTSLVCTALSGSLHNLWCGLLFLSIPKVMRRPNLRIKTISSHTFFIYLLSSGNWGAMNSSLHMEKKELWHEMLTTYRCLMRFENGITLPNIIGAYHLYDSSIDLSSSQCVVHILNDILESQKPFGVLINRCNDIHNYILSIADKHLNNPVLKDRIFGGLYDKNLQEHLSNVDKLAEHLYSIHREEIILKKFSFRDGNWQKLSVIEIQHINNIIKSL